MAQVLGLEKPWKTIMPLQSWAVSPLISLSTYILFSSSSPEASTSLALPKASTGRTVGLIWVSGLVSKERFGPGF